MPSLLSLTRLFSPTPSCDGTGQDFGPIGAGNRAADRDGPNSSRTCVTSFDRMSKENLLWGAPRIHGELLKLGFELAESTVCKYMIKRRGPPSQRWRAFLGNHAEAIAAIDLCVVPTLTLSDCLRFWSWVTVGDSFCGSPSPVIRRRSGWRSKSWRHFPGTQRRSIWCATMIPPTGRSLPDECGRWAFATGRSRRDRPGKIPMSSD